jgi:hypothetical protein
MAEYTSATMMYAARYGPQVSYQNPVRVDRRQHVALLAKP